MKTEHQVSNFFTDLKVFENPLINQNIDSIYNILESNFGEIGYKFMVCGSVAKILHGDLPENYQPKDIDLVARSPIVWRFLLANIYKIANTVSISVEHRRVIIYFTHCCIEIWKMMENDLLTGIYKGKIHYCYGDQNERSM